MKTCQVVILSLAFLIASAIYGFVAMNRTSEDYAIRHEHNVTERMSVLDQMVQHGAITEAPTPSPLPTPITRL